MHNVFEQSDGQMIKRLKGLTENDGHEIDGHENDGHEIGGQLYIV